MAAERPDFMPPLGKRPCGGLAPAGLRGSKGGHMAFLSMASDALERAGKEDAREDQQGSFTGLGSPWEPGRSCQRGGRALCCGPTDRAWRLRWR